MARRVKAFDIWKEMRPALLWRLAAAVFLVFSILGPLSILMESSIHTVSWLFVLVQSVASGGMAGSIILLARRRWWVILVVVIFWTGVIGLNAGGLNFLVGDEGFRVRLGTEMGLQGENMTTPVMTLQPHQLDAIYEQRGALGILAIALLAAGYTMFINVIRTEVKHRARLEAEVKIAREIQESLLPEGSVESDWYTASGAALPATEVGGDFFDIIRLRDDRLAVAIADVTGHGVGAGILGAMTKSALRAELVHDSSPLAVLTTVNAALVQLSDEKTFVTFAYALIDKSTKAIRYATAGHPPLFLLRSRLGTIEQLRTVNLALGLRDDAAFATGEVPFEPDDLLVLYTDGILEAADPRGEEFGEQRLRRSIIEGPRDPRELFAALLKTLTRFAGSSSFQDDVSILSIRFLSRLK